MSGLPTSWARAKIGDVVAFGRSKKAESAEIPSDAWMLDLEDVERDTSTLLTRVSAGQRKSKSTKNAFKRGDVLYGKLRPYLNKVLLATEDGFCSTEIVPLDAEGAVDQRYLFHWLKSPEFLAYVTAASHGMNMPRLGTEAGNAAPFVVAPLCEQARIADKLDKLLARVDACRDRLDAAKRLVKQLRRSVLQAVYSLRLPNELEIESRSIRVGAVLKDLRYGTSKRSDYNGGKQPVLRIPNVSAGVIDSSDLKSADFDDDEVRKLALQAGDLLVIRSNGSVELVGRPALVTESHAGYLFAGYLIRLRPDPLLVDSRFLSMAIQSPQVRNVIEMTARSTSGVNNLNAEEIKALELQLPPLDVQIAIAERAGKLLELADRLSAAIDRAVAATDRQTASVLAKAFRGELVPQDPADEPAERMLERLRTTEAPRAAARRRRSPAPA